VEESGVPGEKHWYAAREWLTVWLILKLDRANFALDGNRVNNFNSDKHWLHRLRGYYNTYGYWYIMSRLLVYYVNFSNCYKEKRKWKNNWVWILNVYVCQGWIFCIFLVWILNVYVCQGWIFCIFLSFYDLLLEMCWLCGMFYLCVDSVACFIYVLTLWHVLFMCWLCGIFYLCVDSVACFIFHFIILLTQ